MKKSICEGYGKSQQFQTNTNKEISSIELYGIYRLSLRVVYTDNSAQIIGYSSNFRGYLDLRDDQIIKIDYCVDKYIKYLCFRTLKGLVLKGGEPNIDIKSFEIGKIDKLIGFYGNGIDWIESFGIIFNEKIDENPKDENLEIKKKSKTNKNEQEKVSDFKEISII